MASTSKAIELQLQVKQNAEELQDFMRDLEHWENDIRQKDMELRRQGGVPEEVKEGFWYDNLLLVCVQCVCVHTHAPACVGTVRRQRTAPGNWSSLWDPGIYWSHQAWSKHFDLLSVWLIQKVKV